MWWPLLVASALAATTVFVLERIEPEPTRPETQVDTPASAPVTAEPTAPVQSAQPERTTAIGAEPTALPESATLSGALEIVLDGETATINVGTTSVGLTTTRIGEFVPPPGVVEQRDNEVVHVWPGVEEWYRLTGDGVMHGYTIGQPLHDENTLEIEVVIEGAEPVAVDTRSARLATTDGERLSYRNLVAFDADGDDLPASLEVVDDTIVLTVDTTDADFPITVDPVIAEDQQLLIDDYSLGEFGDRVDISGDLAVVADPADSQNGFGTGAVTLFERSGGTSWTEVAKFTGDAAGDRFGWDVAVYDRRPGFETPDAVGAIGSVGDFENAPCGANTAMVGVTVWRTSQGAGWLRALEPICTAIDGGPGSYSLSPTTFPGPQFNDPNDFGQFGPEPPVPAACPPGQVVTGFQSEAGLFIDFLQLACAPFNADGTVGAPSFIPLVGADATSALLGPFDCADGFATGLSGRSGDDIHSIALQCSRTNTDADPGLVFVGAPGDDDNGADSGAVTVYRKVLDSWVELTKLYLCDDAPCDPQLAGGALDEFEFGYSLDLDASGNLFVGAPATSILADGQVAVIDGSDGTLTALLGDVSAVPGESFGSDVAVTPDGDDVLVGSPLLPGSTGSGRAAWYRTTGIGWTQRAVTQAGVPTFGAAVAMDDVLGVIGEPPRSREGAAGGTCGNWYAYRIGDSTSAADSGPTTIRNAGLCGGNYASALALDDDTLYIGMAGTFPTLPNRGAIQYYAWNGTTLNPSGNAQDSGLLGTSIAADAGLVIGGAPGSAEGSATIRTSTSPTSPAGTFVTTLTPTAGTGAVVGNADDRLGSSVDIVGNRMVVGAPFADLGQEGAGAVYVYQRDVATSPWNLVATIESPDPEQQGGFGDSVTLSPSGTRIAVGESDRLGDEAEPGRVFAFELQANTWVPLGTPITLGVAPDAFGASVAWVDDSRLAIGAPAAGGADQGAVYATAYSGSAWALPVVLTSGTPDAGDSIGYAVAAGSGPAGQYVVAGAPFDDDAGTDGGAVYVWQDTGSGFGALTPVQKIAPDSAWSTGDRVGTAVAIDGARIAVAGLGDQQPGATFSVHAIEIATPGNPSTWAPTWRYSETLSAAVDSFPNGYVDVRGGNIALGRPGGGGQVGVFHYNGVGFGTGPTVAVVPGGTVPGDRVGFATAIDGRTVIVGAPGVAAPSTNQGAVYSADDVPIAAVFTGANDERFQLAGNWDQLIVPGSSDTAVVPEGLEMEFDIDTTVARLGAAGEAWVLANQQVTISGTDGGPSVVGPTGILRVVNDAQLTSRGDLNLVSGSQLVVFGDPVAPATTPGVLEFDPAGGALTLGGAGLMIVSGEVRAVGPGAVTVDTGVSWNAGRTSVLRATQGADISVLTTNFDGRGGLDAGAGSSIAIAGNLDLRPSSVVEVSITGSSDDTANYGRIAVAGSVGFQPYPGSDIDQSKATLRSNSSDTTFTATDSYPVLTCGDCSAAEFDRTETAGLDAVQSTDAVRLQIVDNKLRNPIANGFGADFGESVAVDGAWAVAGEPVFGEFAGAVYVLNQNPGTGAWEPTQGFTGGFNLGLDVAIDGNTFAATTSDEVVVYSRLTIADDFEQVDSTGTFNTGAIDLRDGHLLTVDPTPASESVTIYEFDVIGGLTQEVVLTPVGLPAISTSDFGAAVAIGGDPVGGNGIAVVGAPQPDGGGSVLVYRQVNGTWQGTPAVLNSPDPTLEGFGAAVAADGDLLVVGEPRDLDNVALPATLSGGAAWVYEWNGSTYDLVQRIDPDVLDVSDQFGGSVTIDGGTIVVGARGAANSLTPYQDGAAYVFQFDGADWTQTQVLRAADGFSNERFGTDVGLSGESVLIGAPRDSGPGDVFNTGAVYWFDVPIVEVPDVIPTLDVSISTPTSSAEVGVSSIELSDLPGSAFQGYGGPDAEYVESDLQTLDLRDDLGNPDDQSPIFDVTLGELALAGTPITDELLDTILLTEIPVEGGWSAGLNPGGPPLVEQTLTLLDVYTDYPAVAASITLGDLDLSSNNLGSISTYAALLAGTSVVDLPSPTAADDAADPTDGAYEFWCGPGGPVDVTGLSCVRFGAGTEATAGGLTLPRLSFAGVDVEQPGLLGTPVEAAALTGTPIGDLPLGELRLDLVPLASQPYVPSKAMPTFLPPTLTPPPELDGVTLGELGGAAPLAALTPDELVDSSGTSIGSLQLSLLDLEYRPDSPLQDYLWVPPAAGASLLISSEAPLSTAIADMPVGELGLEAPVLSVPLGDIMLPNGRAIGEYRLSELLAATSPFGASPFGASPFGASPFGASPFGASPFGASPFGASPFGASPFGASPFGASPFGASPFGASPFGASPFGASPFGASPFGASPFGASPFGASPFGASPFGASPFGASPFGASPFGASPFGASPFGASPLSELGLAAPVTAVPLSGNVGGQPLGDYRLADLDPTNLLFDLPIQAFVSWDEFDCGAIDCRQPNGFTIADAIDAGALSDQLTLTQVQPGLFGLTIGDLVGANAAFTESVLAGFVAAISLTLADAETAGLIVSGVPIQLLDAYDEVTIEQARLLFSGWRLIDLVGLAEGLDETDVRAAFDDWADASTTALTIGDLTRKLEVADTNGLDADELWVDTLALSTIANAAASPTSTTSLTIADAWSLLTPLRLEHLDLDLDPTATRVASPSLNAAAAGTTLGAELSPPTDPIGRTLEGLLWGDIIGSGEVPALPLAETVTVSAIVESFAGVTLGEFLRAAQPITDQRVETIDLDTIDLADYSDGATVTFDIGVELVGGDRPDGARIVASLPAGSRYDDGSSQLLEDGVVVLPVESPDPALSRSFEPTRFGDSLVWQAANLQPDRSYTVRFGVQSSASTGPFAASTSVQLLSFDVFGSAETSIEFVEALEPNDLPGQASELSPDQIVLSQISATDDVDLYRVSIDTLGTQLGATLWNLPEDFDLTIIGPAPETLVPTGGQTLDSVGDGGSTVGGDADASTIGDAGSYQPPAGSDLVVVARSTGRGTATETIAPIPTFAVGDYYIVVSGYDGATSDDPYALRAEVDAPPLAAPECAAGDLSFPFDGEGVDAVLPSPSAEPNTLYLINHERFGDQYGAAAADAVLGAINDLSAAVAPGGQLGEFGLAPMIVDLGAVGGAVADAYAAWDAKPCGLAEANAVVAAIASYLNGDIYLDNPEIEHVVVVGSDRMIPFGRLADRTALGNELNYATTFAGDIGTPLYAALAGGTFFSDDVYVDSQPNLVGDRALYLPERAIGRLVQDPTSIIGQLEGFVDRGGVVRTDSALVAGYDFLADSSEAIAERLDDDADDNFDGPVSDGGVVELISETWTAADLIGGTDPLFVSPTGETPGIGSLNGHFSHQGAQAALGSATGDESDAIFVDDIGITDFAGSLIFTPGCHSGLSPSEELTIDLGVDWAETFGGAGVAAYVAQTGFGYGNTDSIQLTEELLVDFAELLDGNYTIGEALKLSKNGYITGSVSVYDEKTVQQAVLYGLPFAKPDVAAPPARPPAPDPVPVGELEPGSGLYSGTVVTSFEFERQDRERGTVFEVDGQSYAPPNLPLQPIATVDTTAADDNGDGEPDFQLRGAIIRGGSAYRVVTPDTPDPNLIDPIYQTPTLAGEGASSREPETIPVGAAYPGNPLAVIRSTTEFGTRDLTEIRPGKFIATEPNGDGAQFLYPELVLQTFFSNDDTTEAPVIQTVSQSVIGTQFSVTATTPSVDVEGVVVAYLEDADGASETAPAVWRSFSLTASAAGVWTGQTAIPECLDSLDYIVQMYTIAGAVGVSANKALGFESTCEEEPPIVDPETTVTPTPSVPTSGWYTGPVTLTITTDLPSVEVTIGSDEPVVLDDGDEFTIDRDGVTTYRVRALDGDLLASGEIQIDSGAIAPIVTIDAPVGDVPAGRPVAFIFECDDPSLASCTGTLTPNPDPDLPDVFGSGADATLPVGTYTLTVTGTDAFGAETQAVQTFDATPGDPVITDIFGPAEPIQFGGTATVEIDFTDPEGTLDDYTVEFDWGVDLNGDPVAANCIATSAADGSTAESTCSLVEPNGDAGSATATITYPGPGVYTVEVTVTDASGLEATAVYEYVVIFDPSGGRVAGSGLYWSDPAADFDDGGRWGNLAFFGYYSRYRSSSATTPSGVTKLKLLGGLKFRSTAYDYLVINDSIAVTEGVGKVNGETGYRMRVQGIDHGWVDYFQITIWDDVTGEVVYDNGVLYEDTPAETGDPRGDRIFGRIRIIS